MAWHYALTKTRTYYIKDWRGGISSVGVGIFSLIALRILGGKEIMQNEWIVFLSGAIGALGGVLLLLVLSRIGAPSKLYREKEILADLYTWIDVEITEFKHDELSIFGDGIVIKNNKPFDIEVSVWLTELEKNRSVLEHIRDKKQFGWIGEETNELSQSSAVIEKNGSAKSFVIADYKGGDTASLQCGSGLAMHTDADYVIRIEIRGIVKRKDIEPPKLLVFHLRLENEELKLGMIKNEENK